MALETTKIGDVADGEEIFTKLTRKLCHLDGDGSVKVIDGSSQERWISPSALCIPASALSSLQSRLEAAEAERDEWKRKADDRLDNGFAAVHQLLSLCRDPNLVKKCARLETQLEFHLPLLGEMETERDELRSENARLRDQLGQGGEWWGLWNIGEKRWRIKPDWEMLVAFVSKDAADRYRRWEMACPEKWEVRPLLPSPPLPEAEKPKLPEGTVIPEGWEWTGEIRLPKSGEAILVRGDAIVVEEDYESVAWPILRRKPSPPAADHNAKIVEAARAFIDFEMPSETDYNVIYDRLRTAVRSAYPVKPEPKIADAPTLTSELAEVVRIVKMQREGPYTTESDAVAALQMVRRMAEALLAEKEGPK